MKPSAPPPSPATDAFVRALAVAGLDLVRAFDVARYDAAVEGHAILRPLAPRDRGSALGFVVGNTRALWPRFLEAYAARPALRASPHPLDAYVESELRRAAAHLGVACRPHFAHAAGPERVSMLHAAQASGLAHVGPAHLAVHPEHGPWLGLRALVVVDAPPPRDEAPPAPSPCAGCAAPCVGALDAALAQSRAAPRGQEEIAAAWRAWVAVRDACPVGAPSRYGEDQLRYHYTKDRAVLGDTR